MLELTNELCTQLVGTSACTGTTALPKLTFDGVETHYTPGAGDQLRITACGENQLTGEYLVDGAGAIASPSSDHSGAGRCSRSLRHPLICTNRL